MDNGICKGCGKPIVWILTKGGKAMPCDPEGIGFQPDKKGADIFITEDGSVIKGDRQDAAMMRGYISHFATCEAASYFRRKG